MPKVSRACMEAAWHWRSPVKGHIQVTLWAFEPLFVMAAVLLVSKRACYMANQTCLYIGFLVIEFVLIESKKNF